jgi:hypothetical protein
MMLWSKKYIYLSQRGRLVCSKPQEKSTAASFLGERAEYIIRLERATGVPPLCNFGIVLS